MIKTIRLTDNYFLRTYSLPVIFTGIGLIPPATSVNYVPWTIVGFIFQSFIRRRYFSWWTKYNYILSAALDSGVAIAVIVIFFTLQFPGNNSIGSRTIQSWWGNTVYTRTADWNDTSLRTLNPGETFGPSSW